jgi:hypothetical protein
MSEVSVCGVRATGVLGSPPSGFSFILATVDSWLHILNIVVEYCSLPALVADQKNRSPWAFWGPLPPCLSQHQTVIYTGLDLFPEYFDTEFGFDTYLYNLYMRTLGFAIRIFG